jgi:hypothetical protein
MLDFEPVDPRTARIIRLFDESEYFKNIKNKKEFALKIEGVFLFDIGNEIKKMDIWLYANPHKRYKNYKRFIVGWLSSKLRKGER